MTLTVCIAFHSGLTLEDGSTMFCREIEVEWPTVPRIGDHIEVLPERADSSSWDAEVTRVYFHGDGSVELHVGSWRRQGEVVSAEMVEELHAYGYWQPGEDGT